jgi:hypothetical protein
MCKFDKNQSYSTRTVFEALNNKFPEEKEETLFPLIGQRFTALKLVPVNKQKKNRFFSGTDCQTVFDYYDKKFCKKYGLPYKKEKDKQVTVFEVLKPKKEKGLSITFGKKKIADEIEKRAKAYNVTRVQYVTDILEWYFKEFPFNDLEHKTEGLTTRQDWLNFIRENYEKGES